MSKINSHPCGCSYSGERRGLEVDRWNKYVMYYVRRCVQGRPSRVLGIGSAVGEGWYLR